MLDCFYWSLSDLIRACREARAYIRTGQADPACGGVELYRIKRVLAEYAEEIRFVNGQPVVTYRALGF